ncbi:MAG: hypothetical protein U5N86_03335 [Planctomycetota bacterium]|nr:hypothetical protein [Planctomycetota bacterium]
MATVIFGLLAKVFRAAVARKKASSGHLVLFIAVKVLIVAAGLSVAILVGRPAVIGLFVGVTVALAGTVGAGIKED